MTTLRRRRGWTAIWASPTVSSATGCGLRFGEPALFVARLLCRVLTTARPGLLSQAAASLLTPVTALLLVPLLAAHLLAALLLVRLLLAALLLALVAHELTLLIALL